MDTEEQFPLPDADEIFVFGSNLAGRHGRGAALDAMKLYGAAYGRGIGHVGRSYAIPTKDYQIKTLPLERIKRYVDQFLDYARKHPDLKFFVTRVGCGLAGYQDKDIEPMFRKAPANCRLPEEWLAVPERHLEDCPFCAGTNITLQKHEECEVGWGNAKYFGFCRGCGASSGLADSKQAAADRWNQRAPAKR